MSGYTLIAKSWRRATPKAPWHILGIQNTTPRPSRLGLCGTETSGDMHAEVAWAGLTNGDSKLCERCRRAYGQGGAFIAQGPRPVAATPAAAIPAKADTSGYGEGFCRCGRVFMWGECAGGHKKIDPTPTAENVAEMVTDPAASLIASLDASLARSEEVISRRNELMATEAATEPVSSEMVIPGSDLRHWGNDEHSACGATGYMAAFTGSNDWCKTCHTVMVVETA